MASEPLIGGAAVGGAGAAAIKDVSTANFMAEVVDASFETPLTEVGSKTWLRVSSYTS